MTKEQEATRKEDYKRKRVGEKGWAEKAIESISSLLIASIDKASAQLHDAHIKWEAASKAYTDYNGSNSTTKYKELRAKEVELRVVKEAAEEKKREFEAVKEEIEKARPIEI